MTSRLFRQASIPAETAKEVVAIIREHPEVGYRTLSEFVRAGTSAHLRAVEAHLALRTLRHTAELGAGAVEALLRDAGVRP